MAHRPPLSALPLVAACLLSTGCAGRVDPFDRTVSQAGREVASLEVHNRSWEDLVVYATRGPVRYRLGMVMGLGDGVFVVPSSVVDQGLTLSLAASPVGSQQSYHAPPLALSPGDRVVWRLQSALEHSDVSVRTRRPE
jgi:hypothetical protein